MISLGGVNAAQLLLHSFNYADIAKNHAANNWAKTTQMVIEAGIGLKNSGARGYCTYAPIRCI
jgi:aspartate racemase